LCEFVLIAISWYNYFINLHYVYRWL